MPQRDTEKVSPGAVDHDRGGFRSENEQKRQNEARGSKRPAPACPPAAEYSLRQCEIRVADGRRRSAGERQIVQDPGLFGAALARPTERGQLFRRGPDGGALPPALEEDRPNWPNGLGRQARMPPILTIDPDCEVEQVQRVQGLAALGAHEPVELHCTSP
jgi:hypothetical protein